MSSREALYNELDPDDHWKARTGREEHNNVKDKAKKRPLDLCYQCTQVMAMMTVTYTFCYLLLTWCVICLYIYLRNYATFCEDL